MYYNPNVYVHWVDTSGLMDLEGVGGNKFVNAELVGKQGTKEDNVFSTFRET